MDGESISPVEFKARCLACSHSWHAYGWDYGDQKPHPLQCRKCDRVSWVQHNDSILIEIIQAYKSVMAEKILSSEIYVDVFKVFAETCDPCDCGGAYVWSGQICPKCLSGRVQRDWIGCKLAKMEFVKITHKNLNAKEFSTKLAWLVPHNIELYRRSNYVLPKPR